MWEFKRPALVPFGMFMAALVPRLRSTVFLALALATQGVLADELSARTHSVLGPTHLLWRVSAGLRAPGLGGIDGAIDLTLPFAPIYVGVRGQESWGYTTQEFNGPQWQGATTVEGRAGFTLSEGWSLRGVQMGVETHLPGGVTLTSDRFANPAAGYRYSTVTFDTPVFYRWTLFAGAIRRWQFIQNTDTGQPFGTLGVSWFRRHDAVAEVEGFGNFTTDRSETWTLQATYGLGTNASLTVPRRLGAIVEYAWQTSVLALTFSAGYDGQLVLGSVGVGLGAAHSLGGPVPQASDLR